MAKGHHRCSMLLTLCVLLFVPQWFSDLSVHQNLPRGLVKQMSASYF